MTTSQSNYYHVVVTPKSNTSSREVSLDLSLEELDSRVIEPYNKGQTLIISGKALAADDVDRISVTASNEASRAIRARVETELRRLAVPNFSGVSDTLIAAEGQDVTAQFIVGPPGRDVTQTPQVAQQPRPMEAARDVFVVHGRNAAARDALFDFLRAIDLHPLEWSEAVRRTGKTSPYIGEILDAAFGSAHAIVVLLSPDDEARLKPQFAHPNDPSHETQLTGQARPNVLFEAGMAMARSQDRTVLIELGDLRPFSDIAGRHAIRLDNSTQRRQDLAQRLELAGCPANREGTAWHTAGDFEGALAFAEVERSQSDISTYGEVEPAPQHGLSNDAVALLVEASKDPNGDIVKVSTQAGLFIRTNGRGFVEDRDPKSEARWRHALDELIYRGLVEDNTGHGEVFQVTWPGHQIAAQLAA